MSTREELFQSALRVCRVERNSSWDSYGFHLSKGKLETYPRVSKVDPGSPATSAGVRDGDYLVAVNGKPVLGEKISHIATRIRHAGNKLELLLWTPGELEQCQTGTTKGPGTVFNVDKISTCLRSLLSLLDCPVCLETITPPAFQCLHGHLVCRRCRSRTSRCPTCRDAFSRARPILADQLYSTLMETFLPRPNVKSPPRAKKSFFVSVLPVKAVAAFVGLPQSLDLPFGKKKDINPAEILHPPPVDGDGTLGVSSLEDFPGQANHREEVAADAPLDTILNSTAKLEYVQFHCPFSLACESVMSYDQVFQHIQHIHSGPLIHIYWSKMSLSLQLRDDGNPEFLPTCFFVSGSAFFLESISLHNDEVCFWLWHFGNDDIEKWNANLLLHPSNDKKSTGNSYILPIFSLSTSKEDITKSYRRFTISKDNLRTNCKSNILLKIDVEIWEEDVASGSLDELEVTQL